MIYADTLQYFDITSLVHAITEFESSLVQAMPPAGNKANTWTNVDLSSTRSCASIMG